MPNIVPIVEGPGEEKAIPVLCSKLLHEMGRYDVFISTPKRANGIGNLTKVDGLERLLEAAFREANCAAVLVIVDADEACALQLAKQLAKRVYAYGARLPVAVVVAKCEYEAWFLASIPTLVGRAIREGFTLPENLRFDGDVEGVSNAKGWITNHLPRTSSHRSVAYDEARDQVTLTRLIDPTLARERSRSFRRMCHAIEQIVDAIDNSKIVVTPEAD